MAIKKENSVITEIKTWLFPSAVTLIGLFAGMMLKDIKEDLAEVKSDVKALMVQSSVDKTRIDNLEREVYEHRGKTASFPMEEEAPRANVYAVLPNTKLTSYGN
jgi:uncharacterized membrane-anchored protein YhcB (DUF1043 family)